MLLFTHIYLTIKLKFPQKNIFKGFWYIIKSDKKNSTEGISSYKSLMTVLAGTLGTGNIIGVSTAICIGGIGSIFWITISGIFAIATKYAETYIVLKYRNKTSKEKYGGTMYVLKNVLGKKGLGTIFAIVTIIASLGVGCMIQSNAITNIIIQNYNLKISNVLISIIVTTICAYAVLGNEKRISDISSVLIPISSIIFISLNIAVLITFKENIVLAITNILKEAFHPQAIFGGATGFGIIQVIKTGLSQGLFSNEAGMGSSPIFDATVKEEDIKKQAIISSTTVFLDTVLLCTMTGLVITVTNIYKTTNNPINLISLVFNTILFGKTLIVISTIIFAIATIPCWSYISKIAVRYLSKDKNTYIKLYKCIFIVFVFIGGITALDIVWSISNIANILMILPNIYMIYMLVDKIE